MSKTSKFVDCSEMNRFLLPIGAFLSLSSLFIGSTIENNNEKSLGTTLAPKVDSNSIADEDSGDLDANFVEQWRKQEEKWRNESETIELTEQQKLLIRDDVLQLFRYNRTMDFSSTVRKALRKISNPQKN